MSLRCGSGGHLDAVRLLLGGRFRDRHGQHSIRERRLKVLRIDPERQLDRPRERAIRTFGQVMVGILLFDSLLATQSQDIVGKFDLNILLGHAGEFGRNADLLVGLSNIEP
jgi:hypothetical protein